MLFALLASALGTGQAAAQNLTINTGLTPAQYVYNFVDTSGGLTVSNIIYSGAPAAIGNFTNSAQVPNFDMASGLILSTGDVNDAPGPNSSGSITTNNGTGSDPQLQTISSNINDAAFLQFDFVPQGDSISFNFIFSSDEYNEFANSSFNDAFGFFIQGPGFPAFTNIALLPTAPPIPVTINNVNNTSNPVYYIDNENPPVNANIEYDGLTVKLTAAAEVVPCSTYTFKIAIGDVFDSSYDSAVFLEEGSFSVSGVVTQAQGNVDINGNVFTYEGCDDAAFVLSRDTLNAQDTVVVFYEGDAIAGQDYSTLPDTLVFSPGQDTLVLGVPTIFDGITEGDDTLTLGVPRNTLCGGLDTIRTNIIIRDVDSLQTALPADTAACVGDTMTLAAQVTGGVPGGYTYVWLNGVDTLGTDSIYSEELDSTATWTLIVNDSAGCSTPVLTHTIDITLGNPLNPITAIAPPDTSICEQDSITLTASGTGGGGVYNYSWEVNGVEVADTNTVTLSPDTTTTYDIIVDDGCEIDQTSFELTVFPVPGADFDILSDTACTGDLVSIDYANSGLVPGTQFLWAYGAGASPDSSNDFGDTETTWNTPGEKFVVLTTFTPNCTNSDTDSIFVKQTPVVFAGPDKRVCAEDTTFLEGDTAFVANPNLCTIEWTHLGTGNVISNELQPIVAPLVTTSYQVQITCDGCPGTPDTVLVEVDENPGAEFTFAQDTVCTGDSLLIEYDATGLVPGIQFDWNFGPGANPPNATTPGDQTVLFLVPGQQEISLITTTSRCTTQYLDTLIVNQTPVGDAGTDLYVCEGDSVQLPGTNNGTNNAQGCQVTWSVVGGGVVATELQPFVTPTADSEYILNIDCGACQSTPDTVLVEVVEKPLVTLDSNQVEMCLGAVGDPLPANVTAGTPPYTYQWSPTNSLSNANVLNPNPNPTSDITYTLVVTDSLGCLSDSIPVDVIVHDPPVPDAGPEPSVCAGQEGTLNGSATGGSGSYEYQWLPTDGITGDPTSPVTTFQTDTSITYTLVVTDALTGCTVGPGDSTATVTVNPIQPVNAVAGPDTVDICLGDSTHIGDPVAGTLNDVTYSWSTTAGLANPNSGFTLASPATTTTYILNTERLGCPGEPDTVVLDVRPSPVVDFTPPTPLCPYDTVQFEVEITNGTGPFTYDWGPDSLFLQDSVQDPFFHSDITTGFSLTVSSADNCTVTEFYSVQVETAPFVDADVDSENNIVRYCRDEAAQGVELNATAAGPATWLPPLSTNDLSPLVDPEESTDYILEAEYGQNCVVRDTVRVLVQPGIDVTIEASDDTVCYGDPVSLTAVGGIGAATYEWTPANGLDNTRSRTVMANPPILAGDTLNYNVTVSEAGCVDDTSITLTVLPKPELDFSIVTAEGCVPFDAQFLNTSVNSTFYLWDFGNGDTSGLAEPRYQYTEPGLYQVTLMGWSDSTRKCIDTLTSPTPVLVYEQPEANFNSTPGPEDTIYLPMGGVQFEDSTQGAIAWNWSFGDGQSALAANPYHQFQIPGTFEVTLIVEAEGGCVDTTSTTYVVAPEQIENIPNVFTPTGRDGFNDFFTVDYTGDQPYSLTIYDRWGRAVFSTNTPNPGWDGTDASGGDAAAGVYFYVAKIGDRVFEGNVTLLR